MLGLRFNGTRKEWITVLHRRAPYWAPRKRKIVSVPSAPGGHLVNTTIDARVLPVRIMVEANDEEDYRRKGEEFAQWLNIDHPAPLIFDQEPNRVYYAVVDGALDPDELVTTGFVDVNFVCPDPYKYGQEHRTITLKQVTWQDYKSKTWEELVVDG